MSTAGSEGIGMNYIIRNTYILILRDHALITSFSEEAKFYEILFYYDSIEKEDRYIIYKISK
jgi:hypothetical protein